MGLDSADGVTLSKRRDSAAGHDMVHRDILLQTLRGYEHLVESLPVIGCRLAGLLPHLRNHLRKLFLLANLVC
jgi:hypothetical protein